VPSCIPDPSLSLPNGGAFEPTPVQYLPTIFDRLNTAGLSWRIYGTPYSPVFVPKSEYAWSICPSLAECEYTSQVQNLVQSLQFTADAQSGNLPAYSIVVPGNSTLMDGCHNLMSATACDNWVGQMVGAVESGPDWGSTAIFITFDDCGCFYDQVVPGKNPDGTQRGPRTPLIIVSPYAKPGYTDTTASTFAGILAYVEQTFGLAPLGVNDARAYDFSNVFNYNQAPRKAVRMVTRPLSARAKWLAAHPPKALLNDPT
jgi:phospholipase C